MRIKARVIVKNYELEERRKNLNLTQAEFADIVGMNVARYQNIEQMKILPREEEAKNIALELGGELEVLFPKGYERLVDVFKVPMVRVGEYTAPLLESEDDGVLLLEQSNAKLTVATLLVKSGLSPKEFEILEMRSGIKDGTPYTYEEVGKHFGVSRERVRQIEAKGLERMRGTAYKLNIKP